MNNLVIMKDHQAVTSSLQVAESFEKQHKNVLAAIDTKIKSLEILTNHQNMFIEGDYKDSRGRKQRLYYMNRDGFKLLTLGFTGQKALIFKLKYFELFDSFCFSPS